MTLCVVAGFLFQRCTKALHLSRFTFSIIALIMSSVTVNEVLL